MTLIIIIIIAIFALTFLIAKVFSINQMSKDIENED